MDCVRLANCPFYNDKMPMEKGIGSVFKKKYCTGNQNLCARYHVISSIGEPYVPDSLYPNMIDIAKKIIDDANKIESN